MSESEEFSSTCILYIILIAIIMIIVGSILGAYVYMPLLGIMGFGVIILICLICGFMQPTRACTRLLTCAFPQKRVFFLLQTTTQNPKGGRKQVNEAEY